MTDQADGAFRQFDLTEEQRAIRDMAADFAREELAPKALEWDEKKHFPVDVLRKAAALGMGGIYISDEYGGSGLRPAAPPSPPTSPSTTWRRG